MLGQPYEPPPSQAARPTPNGGPWFNASVSLDAWLPGAAARAWLFDAAGLVSQLRAAGWDVEASIGGRPRSMLLEPGAVAELWQPPGPLPYRADVAFDLDDPDSVGVACAAGSGPGPSLVREVGDGRLLSAARRIDATDRLVLPALAASVRGLAAREWMTGDALDAIGRLGVARLRWHVEPAGRDEAESLAAQLGRPGRPAISVAPEGTSPLFLEIAGPPRRPKAATLSAALDALTGVRWRSGRPLGERLRDLTGGGDDPPLAPDAPASLLLLRPQVAGATDPDRLEIEAVFLDGREPALEP